MSDSALEVAERLFTALEAGDVEAVRALYAPEARVWHNFDGVEQTVEENLRTLAWFARNVPGRRYEEVRRQATATGFVQQHVLRGTAPGGKLEMPACIVATVVDGKITRIDEYLDTAQSAVLRR
jgi:ketosteroid isomerase-like protein